MANYPRELRPTLAFPKTTIQGRFSGLDSFADHGECRISEANGRVAIMTGADSVLGEIFGVAAGLALILEARLLGPFVNETGG